MSNWESAQSLQASAAQTSSGAGSPIDLGSRDRLLRQTLTVSTVSGGTPSLTVRLECSADGSTGWRTFGAFTVVSAASVERLTFVSPEQHVRVAWAIAGSTPSFTFLVSGTKGLSFANLEQLDGLGLPAAASAIITPSKRAEQLAATTELAAGILAARYDMPLEAWGGDLSSAVCKIAGYEMLSVRGLNPDGDDKNVRTRYEDAMKWLAEVASGQINPVGIVDATPGEGDSPSAEVVTYAARGWR